MTSIRITEFIAVSNYLVNHTNFIETFIRENNDI